MAPDVLAKVAYDSPKVGHLELKAIGRVFRDRAVPIVTGTGATAFITPGYDNHASGGGVGYGAIIPIVQRKLEFVSQGLFGRGTSRYTDSGQFDFVVQSNGQNMRTVLGLGGIAGFEARPTRKLEVDLLFGDEYYGRTIGSTIAGYGSPTAVNSGCYYETAALATAAGVSSTCTGNNRNLWNGKIMAYYLYKGSYGIFPYGAEVDYLNRSTWSGANGLAPNGNHKTGFLTLRWLLL